jgi:hypothetical protein
MASTRRTAALVLLAGVMLATTSCDPLIPGRPGQPDPTIGGCLMMPADNYWHADVRSLPVSPRSSAWVSSLGLDAKFHTDFGSGEWQGEPIGIPYNVVFPGQPKVTMGFYYPGDSDPGPYPMRWDAPIEGSQRSDGDRHVLTVDKATCKLYEVFDAHRGPKPTSPWLAGSGAVFDLSSNAMRPAGHTSADAAGLPMLPGLVRFEEVHAGHIDHAIRISANRTQNSYIWPARHQAGSTSDPNVPPMGAWLRLRADYPTDGLTNEAKVIVEAMKTHGMIVADNGPSWFLGGVPDSRWNNQTLTQIWDISGHDIEAVDQSSLMVDPNSGQVR